LAHAEADSETSEIEPRLVEANKLLVGESTREWIFSRLVPRLSGENACDGGEAWTFMKNGKVAVKECVDGAWVNRTEVWKLNLVDGFDVQISIGGASYSLFFMKAIDESDTSMYLVLRTYASAPGEPTIDKLFTTAID